MHMRRTELAKLSTATPVTVNQSTSSTTKVAVGSTISAPKSRYIWWIEVHTTASTGGEVNLYLGDASSYTRETLTSLSFPAKDNGPANYPPNPDPSVPIFVLTPNVSGGTVTKNVLYADYFGQTAKMTVHWYDE